MSKNFVKMGRNYGKKLEMILEQDPLSAYFLRTSLGGGDRKLYTS